MLYLLITYRFHCLVRYFSEKPLARIITAFLFLAVLAVVALGIYFFTYSGFQFVLSEPFFREVLPLYLYELFLLVIMFLVLLSSFISGLFQLFSRKNDNWILSSPRFQILPPYVYIHNLITSLWPLVLVAIPILFAIQSVMGLSASGLFIALLSVIILTASTVFTAMIIILLTAKILYLFRDGNKTKALTMGHLILIILFIFLIFSFIAGQRIKSSDIMLLFQTYDLQRTQAGISNIVNQFKIFPSHLSALTIHALVRGNLREAFWSLFSLVLFFIIVCIVLWRCSFWYLPLWQVLQEGGFEANIETSVRPSKPVHFPRFFKGAIGAIFEKEILLTFRTMRNLLWFCFVLFLWLVQTGINLYIGRGISPQEFLTLNISFVFQALQIVIALYFVSAFVLRFTFPSFSAERRSMWILASAPIKFRKIFWVKLLFYSVIFTALSLAIGFINTSVLQIQLAVSSIFLILLLTSVIFVTAFGLSLGAFFPNFETDDPEQLSTSLPGLLFIVSSLAYGALAAWLFYNFLKYESYTPIILFATSSLFIVSWLVSYASRSLERIEFASKQL